MDVGEDLGSGRPGFDRYYVAAGGQAGTCPARAQCSFVCGPPTVQLN